MKVALAINNNDLYTSAARDLCSISDELIRHGHEVVLYTAGENPFPVHPDVQCKRADIADSAKRIAKAYAIGDMIREDRPDISLGFSRIPDLDVWILYNMPTEEKNRGETFWDSVSDLFSKRYHRLEPGLCGIESKTIILHLTNEQKQACMKLYGTPLQRFRLLPPGLPGNFEKGEKKPLLKKKNRILHGIPENQIVLLTVGANLWEKGADRTISAMAHLPDVIREKTMLYLIGKPDKELLHLTKTLHISDQICIEGLKDNVSDYMAMADLMVQPARSEITGTVMLEGLAAGLPIIGMETSAYAKLIKNSPAGFIINNFDQLELDAVMQSILFDPERLKQLESDAVLHINHLEFGNRAGDTVKILEDIFHDKSLS